MLEGNSTLFEWFLALQALVLQINIPMAFTALFIAGLYSGHKQNVLLQIFYTVIGFLIAYPMLYVISRFWFGNDYQALLAMGAFAYIVSVIYKSHNSGQKK